jgi:hypothetical protein
MGFEIQDFWLDTSARGYFMKKTVFKTMWVLAAALLSTGAWAGEHKIVGLKYRMEVQGVGYKIDHRKGSVGATVVTFDRQLADDLCHSNPASTCSGVGRELHGAAIPGLTYDSAAEQVWYASDQGKTLCATVTHRGNFLGRWDAFHSTGACFFVTRKNNGVYFVVKE